MCAKGHVLRTDDQFSRNAVPFQKASRGRRSLKAEDVLPIPDTSEVYRGTHADGRFVHDCDVAAGTAPDGVIQSREISAGKEEIKPNQCGVCTNKK